MIELGHSAGHPGEFERKHPQPLPPGWGCFVNASSLVAVLPMSTPAASSKRAQRSPPFLQLAEDSRNPRDTGGSWRSGYPVPAMGYLLVTNDDGVDSPALLPFMRALREITDVRVVVPDRERSWIGKAITRFGEIRVTRVVREGMEIAVADGFPADCTQLGVHSLFGEAPDMVVSGINVGLNDSLAFFLSSGTAGAAAEGWIAGIPALAFSTGVTRDHRGWSERVWAGEEADLWPRAAGVSADIVTTVRRDGFPEGVDLLNVNFDTNATVDTPRVFTDLAKTGYDRIFREIRPDVFIHDFSTGLRVRGDLAGTDVEAVAKGLVSITQVRLAHAVKLDV